jgi:hypothetical protein
VSILQKHNIDHVSPSSLNTWSGNPVYWGLRYLGGYKFDTTPSMAVGKAVEAALQEMLMRPYITLDEAYKHALAIYYLECPMTTDEKEREAGAGKIQPMLEQAVEVFASLNMGSPKILQNKVTFELSVLLHGTVETVPILGYTDFEWDEVLVDLKTTSRMPSSPKPEHIRQMAFYWRATGKQPALVYVTPKKNDVYTPSEQELKRGWEELEYLTFTLLNALRKADGINGLLSMFPADFSSYQWDDASKAEARKLIRTTMDIAGTY